jgi:alpha-N-arabinofuranosidase
MREGGIHGKHCLCVHNFEDDRWCGVAQSGKYMREGESYHFRGWFRAEEKSKAEIRFYRTEKKIDWENPLAVIPLDAAGSDWTLVEKEFSFTGEDGWVTFSLFVSPGAKLLIDAFSLMPKKTVSGWRPDVVAGLQRVNPKLIRFPGGCFASLHDWRTAIGPMDKRVPEPSYFWGDNNYNDVGTDEFLRLCEALGCEAMLVLNMFHPDKRRKLASATAEKKPGGSPHGFTLDSITDIDEGIRCAAEWVEYCNGPDSSKFGAMRAANGHPEPYNVKYWEMDNETFRWFPWEDYAKTVIRYSEAMKAVDPSVQIGLCSYHDLKFVVREMLDICGHAVDFLADRMCEPDNRARKLEIIRKYNADTGRNIYYTDTEALQNRDPLPAPYIKEYYEKNNITYRSARRTWIYALNLVSNLMMDHRCGGEVRFMCFNNLANTSGQSCIETPKEGVVLPFCGLIYERMSRTEAKWPLKIAGYEPTSRKPIEIQAAWNMERSKLVIYLVNRSHEGTFASLDLSGLGKTFTKARSYRMSAAAGTTQETAKSNGNLKRESRYLPLVPGGVNTFEIPAISWTEVIAE